MADTLAIRQGFANIADVVIAYENLGDVNGEPMVLIMGLGCQLVMWPIGFCERLVEEGYRIIRFDNRDIGLSSRAKSSTPCPRHGKFIANGRAPGDDVPIQSSD